MSEKILIETKGKINFGNDSYGRRLSFHKPKFDIYLPDRFIDSIPSNSTIKITLVIEDD